MRTVDTDLTTGNHEVYTPPLSEDQKKNLLTAQDRCDRCGAQAYVITFKNGFSNLLFCSHHFNSVKENLFKQGFSAIDQSFMLQKQG